MALRISATGFVSMIFIMMLTVTPDCVVGTRTRLWNEDSGVPGMMPSDSTSWRVRLTRQGTGDDSGRNSWRKLLFARRRPPVVKSTETGEPATTNERHSQASKSQLLPSPFHSHFDTVFSFFSSMAKGSSSPSPSTPSPGHN